MVPETQFHINVSLSLSYSLTWSHNLLKTCVGSMDLLYLVKSYFLFIFFATPFGKFYSKRYVWTARHRSTHLNVQQKNSFRHPYACPFRA